MKEKGICGSHLKKKQNKNKRKQIEQIDRGVERVPIFYFIFILLVYFSDSRKFDLRISSGKERKVLYATTATRGYQKHRISPRIQVKIRKILNFWFFLDLRRSNGQNFSDQN